LTLQKSFHIELIATDGKVQRRVLWAHSAPNGVYCGTCTNGEDFHVTYHADGNMFTSLGGKTNKSGTGKSFKEFRGHLQLLWSGVTNSLSHGYYPDYVLKKVNALVSVDVRSYKQDVGVMLFMVEPSFEALDGLVKELQKTSNQHVSELHSFMECTPWIVFVLWTNK
jgi:hypothetical protein